MRACTFWSLCFEQELSGYTVIKTHMYMKHVRETEEQVTDCSRLWHLKDQSAKRAFMSLMKLLEVYIQMAAILFDYQTELPIRWRKRRKII